MFICKLENHVLLFFERQRRYTKRPVFTPFRKDAYESDIVTELRPLAEGEIVSEVEGFGEFFVIAEWSSEEPIFFTGEWSGGKKDPRKKGYKPPVPVFTKDIHRAMFYLDKEASDETLIQMQQLGGYRVTAEKVYLDYKNTLSEQKFLIVCESREGVLSYLKSYDPKTKQVRTCRNSSGCKLMGFRECLGTLEMARSGNKDYRYSMLHDFGFNLHAAKLLGYLRRVKPSNRIALTFKLPTEKKNTDGEK